MRPGSLPWKALHILVMLMGLRALIVVVLGVASSGAPQTAYGQGSVMGLLIVAGVGAFAAYKFFSWRSSDTPAAPSAGGVPCVAGMAAPAPQQYVAPAPQQFVALALQQPYAAPAQPMAPQQWASQATPAPAPQRPGSVPPPGL